MSKRTVSAEITNIWNIADIPCVCDEEALSEMFWDEEKSGWVLL